MSTEKPVADYATYLEECFQGEVYGEALFRSMVGACKSAEAAGKLRVLERLERETKELLRPAVIETGGSGEEDPERIAQGETLGVRLAGLQWLPLMRSFEPPLRRFVESFRRSESLAPPGKEQLVRHVTAHEQALLDFVTRELEGRTGDSLVPVLALLRGSGDAST